MLSSLASVVASCAGWLTAQSFCGARRMRAPLAPPRLSEPRKLEAEAQAVETSADTGRPEASTAFFQRGDILLVDQRMIDRRDRILPNQLFLRHFRAEVARTRPHVAVGQLEPGAGEGVGQLFRVLIEAA